MFNNSTQPTTVQEESFVNRIEKAYRFGDKHVHIWNDGEVDLISKDLKLLMREQYDPEELSDVIEMFDNLVEQYNNKRQNNGVDM